MQLPKISAIHWFGQDLRLADNPALAQAVKVGYVLPIYILDDEGASEYAMGAASRCWLHRSLECLNNSLHGNLSLYIGNALNIITNLCLTYDIHKVFWNIRYEPWSMQQDKNIAEELSRNGIEVSSYNDTLLWKPWQIIKDDGTPYKVFTYFYRKGCLNAEKPRRTIKLPKNVNLTKDPKFGCILNDLKLLPNLSWYNKIYQHWQIGEEAAYKCLYNFVENGLPDYKDSRNFPARSNTSKLSPYLRFGQISPNQIWEIIDAFNPDENTDHFRMELGWREFSYNMLFFNHNLPKENLQKKFNAFLWRNDQTQLRAWQQGMTGIPMVDAGMRELWQTGYMHNRVRMITGSFLVKNLLIDWRYGANWFWDCLVDADLANNSASWQWVAGCGNDAAPHFRIFNPITQGEKFDSEGQYVRKYLPELAKLPTKYIFNPWEAPTAALDNAGIKLGIDYPYPIINLSKSREDALRAFRQL